jgi:hypothetical protein
VAKTQSRPKRTIWAYAFRIVPPQSKNRLRAIRVLIEAEHSASRDGSRTWTGRFIHGSRTTAILIVTDSLERSRAVNRKLEAEFKRLKVDFSVTEPVELPGSTRLGRVRGAKRKTSG